MKALMVASFVVAVSVVAEQPRYEPNWTSLRRHEMPEWMDGMKFGIYCHWGPQTIQLTNKDKELDRLQALELWTGEKFDASAWADLFEKAGAQFAGPVAWHGSGLLNWDSEFSDWTTAKKGPKIDIVGELVSEIRKRDMKVLASFHNNYTIWGPVSKSDPTYLDPDKEDSPLYTANEGRRDEKLLEGWYARMAEAADKYKPDMIWVDTSFGGTVGSELQGRSISGRHLPGKGNELRTIPEPYQQQYLAHLFNSAAKDGREVEFIYKSFDIPPGIGMRDIENGSLIGLQYDPWMADINMAHHMEWGTPWFYNPNNPMKDANLLVDLLVDLVSKNGRMLLSIPPLADGTFTEDQVTQLTALGDWLRLNGEAIYDTVPWSYFGEGPTEETNPGHHKHGIWDEKDKYIPKWTKDDIRFTQNGKNLYAIVLGWPGEALSIRTLGHAGKLYPGDIQSISLLGSDEKMEWEQTADTLTVKFPKEKPCDFAYVLKIERN
ncbi:alpha-L-fucosidase [Pontiella sulfatireligans]|uniref:alpha-L-fucosidase n=1 Tax=Pontiella sulfatireligans TaxID=2750658 RepID=A0A6C2UQU4_9BACT|nr:alpha-L-fucosidase [Pontiella sulfatireligans]VGO22459.1 hypothetical protein SCARR_04542 [Pontiella sulfatireligans]